MEAAGIAVDLVIIVINGQLVDGGILTAIRFLPISIKRRDWWRPMRSF
jgi:hypothetical protein